MRAKDSLQNYTIVRELGRGSYGRALLAKRNDDRTFVCVKEIQISSMGDKEKDAIIQEVVLLAAINHPYIIKYYNDFYENRCMYLCMEYADGGDLSGLIQKTRGSFIEERRILEIFTQIVLALKFLHERKILHRDLKPQNIFLSGDGRVRLGDFGIARVLEQTDQFASTQVGTPYYLSPEICMGLEYNAKSDIWSLGCVVYEMCTHNHPFEASNMGALVHAIVNRDPPTIGRPYSRELQNLIHRILVKDPSKRPSIEDLVVDDLLYPIVTDILSSSTVTPETPSPKRKEEKKQPYRPPSRSPVRTPPEQPIRRINVNRSDRRSDYGISADDRQRLFENQKREAELNKRRMRAIEIEGVGVQQALYQQEVDDFTDVIPQKKETVDPAIEEERKKLYEQQRKEALEAERRNKESEQDVDEIKRMLEEAAHVDTILKKPSKRKTPKSAPPPADRKESKDVDLDQLLHEVPPKSSQRKRRSNIRTATSNPTMPILSSPPPAENEALPLNANFGKFPELQAELNDSSLSEFMKVEIIRAFLEKKIGEDKLIDLKHDFDEGRPFRNTGVSKDVMLLIGKFFMMEASLEC